MPPPSTQSRAPVELFADFYRRKHQAPPAAGAAAALPRQLRRSVAAVRPLHLTLDGFTSFRAPVELDFSTLDLFAITGPTGAGKSSLIDALTFALYGQVPRVGREYKQLMSHGAERLSVRLDFRMGDETYRIARTLKSSGAPAVAAGAALEDRRRIPWPTA